MLETLAYDIYKIPLAGFFVKRIPKDIDPEAKFRRLLSGIDNPKHIYELIHKASCFQAYLMEIYDNESKWNAIPKSRITAKNAALVLGTLLDLQAEYIKKIRTPEEHFEYLRSKPFDLGVYVYKDAFKNDDISGFCLPDAKFPVIMINNSSTSTRQVFTIIHELAHIFKSSFGIKNGTIR